MVPTIVNSCVLKPSSSLISILSPIWWFSFSKYSVSITHSLAFSGILPSTISTLFISSIDCTFATYSLSAV